MKKIGLLISMLFFLLLAEKTVAQNLVCNDLVYISLDPSCAYTITPEDMLEGILFSDCIVEVDKTAPLGNGPWVSPVLGPADVGKTYQARVRHLPSGNACWGNVKVEDKLPPVLKCGGLTTVDLNGGGPVSIAATNLSITAADGCGAANLTPASLQYDCSDLGVNTIQLTASDNSGNSATCLHSILVADQTNCQTCVGACPESVTVSFEEGNIDLLTAFQNNNTGAFDTFGPAWSDATCNPIDSFYNVDYHPGTAGQSWFLRQWFWITGAGQFVNCEQAIVFPTTHTVTVQGKIFLDADDDCVADGGEQPVSYFHLVVTKLPSGTAQLVYPNTDGTYSFDVEFNVQDASAQMHLVLPNNVNPVCPTALDIPNSSGIPSYTFDIGLQSEGDCPRMQVDIGNLFIRRCATNYFKVNYCNAGLDTAYGAFVTVNLDPLIHLESADLPFTVSGTDSLYTFQLGDVAPFHCGTIVIYAAVSCAAELGQTLCNEASIYPDAPCDGNWQGAEVTAKAHCEGDSVSLQLKNIGPLDMAAPLDYIVIEDFIMYRNGAFQLDAGDSITIKAPANGATWRIESEQTPGFPSSGFVAAAIEGCGGLNIPGMINVYGQTENLINFDQYCGVVVGSCDPNDKTAVPSGYGAEHIIRANEPIEYKIRFQNTGTDTAFRVVVVDTLSPMLDARTLEVGASSHPYRMEIYPGGILHFVFNPIALPDSNVNEVASHGYLYFKIAQQPDLEKGTVIENKAAIYFDQNEAVITNTAFHTIGYPILPGLSLSNATQTQAPSCHGAADGSILVVATGGLAPYSYQWDNPDMQGDAPVGLAAGTYHLTLTDSHGGELLKTFELTEPDAVTVTVDATPSSANGSDGTASALASGGTVAYTYLWSNGATTDQISGLSAGVYTVTVTDANGCTQSNSVAVSQTILPLVYTWQITHPWCHGDASGAIQLTVTGGLLPYTFQWSDAGMEGDAPDDLAAGTYQLTLTDAQGNTFMETFVLTEPDVIQVDMLSTPAVGNNHNGTASALVSGGIAPYAYHWSNSATTQQITGLLTGIYTVTVTDENGCTQRNQVLVSQTILPLVYTSQIIHPDCSNAANGAISLTVSGGLSPYTYLWSDPALQGNPVSGLPAGTYHVTITDSNGAQLTETFVLTAPTPIVITMTSTPASGNQHNGSASAMASGGAGAFSYLWDNGATTSQITGLPAGTYTVTVTDANGCSQLNSVVVEQSVATVESDPLSHIQIWPNPAHDRLMMDLHEVLPRLLRIDLLGADGRLLRQLEALDLQPLLTLDLGNVPSAGVILLVLYDRDGSIVTRKVVMQ